MPILDWSLRRKKKNLSKVYKVDVIDMAEEDSRFAAVASAERPPGHAHSTLRKIKSLNDLLENDVDVQCKISKSASGEISKPAGPDALHTEIQELSMDIDSDQEEHQSEDKLQRQPVTDGWSDRLRQRGDKSTGKFIVSGFSTLSRRAGGGMEVPDINMLAVRVFLRNGTHKTIRTNPNTTCKEVLQGVLKKIGLQDSIYQYGLYIQYAISDGRIAPDDEILANINPNTWDSVTRIYLCRKEEFSSANGRTRCASFARDFLEIEQYRRSDINFAYDIMEFTNIQKCIQLSTQRGRVTTMAIQKPSVKKTMVVNKLIVESFAECWAKANRQLNISSDYIESGVNFKMVKTADLNKRKLSACVGTVNRSYTIERGKERRPALAKMLSLDSSTLSVKPPSGIAASPLLQNLKLNMNSNNSNSNLLIPCRAESLVNLHQHNSAGKCHVHPFARPLEHSSSLPVIKISAIKEEDDEIYSTPSLNSLSQSDKSELLHKLSPSSSFSSLDLHTPRKDFYKDNIEADSISCYRSRSLSPRSLDYRNCLLVSSKSLPNFATNKVINTDNDFIYTSKHNSLEFDTSKVNQILPIKKPAHLLVPPPLPPRKHSPSTTYNSNTLPIKRLDISKQPVQSNGQSLEQHDEANDSIGEMPEPKRAGKAKIRRRRSISLSDLRCSLEKKGSKLTSLCNVETLRKATGIKIPGAKTKQLAPLQLIKQPADYQNVSMKELMAIRAAVTSPTSPSSSATFSTSAGSSILSIMPPSNPVKPPVVPKRHLSLFMSSSSNEEILLQYKRLSRKSPYACTDMETVEDNSSSAYSEDIAKCTSADQNTKKLKIKEAKNVYTQDYDHLATEYNHLINSKDVSNTAVTTAEEQLSLGGSQDDLTSSASNWRASPPNVHFDICNKPYDTLEDVEPIIKTHIPRPSVAVLKKPSCSHIYEDVGSDYEDMDDEEYVIMEATPIAPPPPPLPHSFSKTLCGFKTKQQQVTVNNRTKPPMLIVLSEKSTKPQSPPPKSPIEPQIKIMVSKSKANRGGQVLTLQDELKNKIHTRNSETHEQSAPAIQSGNCSTAGEKIPTVSKQPDGTISTELEAKFLAMKNTRYVREEMIEKAELKLATSSNNITKRIKLHNYTNLSKNFMILKEENISPQ